MTDSSSSQPSLTYRDAGVDIDAGNALVERIKSVSRATHRPEVLTGLGGFGAMCGIPPGYAEPILVSGTDGVGTKLKLADFPWIDHSAASQSTPPSVYLID